MAQGKSSEEKKNATHEKKTSAAREKKELATVSPKRTTVLAPRRPSDFRRDFERIFDQFRGDFEDMLWPSERVFKRAFSMIPRTEMRVLHVDLEDRGKDFLLKAEMPGFRKEDVSIEALDDSVEIRAEAGWRQEDEKKYYVVKERGSESLYRMIRLPEDIKADSVEANLKNGVLEVVLPKKAPKQKKRVVVK